MRQRIARLLNNRYVNPFVVFLGIERIFMSVYNPYKNFKADITQKSYREIAGFSHNEYMDKVLNAITSQLKSAIENNCATNSKVLEIGCGPGNFVAELEGSYKMTGLDINESMVEIASKRLPGSEFLQGDFLKIHLNEKYNAVYCIGALQYFYPSQLNAFFLKVSSILNPGGIFFVNFPHALNVADTKFPDLSYISYSPERVRNVGLKQFDIIYDKHTLDDKRVKYFDDKPYENPINKELRTYMNSYTLVFKKK